MSVMRNFRDRARTYGALAVMSSSIINGPDPDKMKEILDRTGYALEVTVGQRKYGGPPPNWEGPATGPVGHGFEVDFPFSNNTFFFRSTLVTFHTMFMKMY